MVLRCNDPVKTSVRSEGSLWWERICETCGFWGGSVTGGRGSVLL